MKAIKLTKPCKVEELKPVEIAKPEVKDGYALVQVKAFGVNESEVTSRKGGSDGDFSFSRVLGIEGVGIISEVAPNSKFKIGQQVATMMGGLGRSIDGSYEEYMLVKEDNLIPFNSALDWGTIGALPEMLQTAYGSLVESLKLQKGERLLIRGGSSTVGLMAIVLAKQLGATVIATTRQEDKLDKLREFGCDYPVLDNQDLKSKVTVESVDKVLELVGVSTLFEDMSFLKDGGTICFTGALGGVWTIDNFSPYSIPKGKYLTSYAGDSHDLPAKALNEVLTAIEKDQLQVPIAKIYHGLAEVSQAQRNLESGKFIGKHIVVL